MKTSDVNPSLFQSSPLTGAKYYLTDRDWKQFQLTEFGKWRNGPKLWCGIAGAFEDSLRKETIAYFPFGSVFVYQERPL